MNVNLLEILSDKISKWFDDNIGDSARGITDKTNQWASDYSEAHSSIGIGDVWQEHMMPAEGLLEMGVWINRCRAS